MLIRICLAIAVCLSGTGYIPPDEIHDAAKAGDVVRLRELLANDGSLVNSPDENMMTPLHYAVDAGTLEAAELLIRNGADVNAPDYQQYTPLHVAARRGNAGAVKLLLENGADPARRELRDRIPLALACYWGRDPETVHLLIDAGSDVNDRNKNEEVLIVLVLNNPVREIVDLLLDHGANIPEEDNHIWRVIWWSASNGMERPFNIAVDMVEKRGLNWWEDLSMDICARGGSVAIGEKLAAKGAAIQGRNPWGVEPLHIAAENGRTEFVEFLLERGCDVDTPSLVGKTALHYALDNGHEDLAALLISKGASQAPPQFPRLEGEYLGQPKPGDKPQPFALGIVSGHGFSNEHSPAVFSPDGTEVYWTKQYRGPVLFMKQENGVWTAPQPAPFCTEYGEGEPIFSPDGNRLYFYSRRPLEAGGSNDKENIWYVKRGEDGWSEPKPISPLINAYELYWSFSLTNDGTIYFASTHDGGLGAQDIYKAKLVDGEYQEPQNLGSTINSPGFQRMPFVAPDESYLLFVSSGDSPTIRNFELYISFKDENGAWMEPMNVGERNSSLRGVACPVVTPDGKYLFCLARGDIYWVDAGFIEKLRPAGD